MIGGAGPCEHEPRGLSWAAVAHPAEARQLTAIPDSSLWSLRQTRTVPHGEAVERTPPQAMLMHSPMLVSTVCR